MINLYEPEICDSSCKNCFAEGVSLNNRRLAVFIFLAGVFVLPRFRFLFVTLTSRSSKSSIKLSILAVAFLLIRVTIASEKMRSTKTLDRVKLPSSMQRAAERLSSGEALDSKIAMALLILPYCMAEVILSLELWLSHLFISRCIMLICAFVILKYIIQNDISQKFNLNLQQEFCTFDHFYDCNGSLNVNDYQEHRQRPKDNNQNRFKIFNQTFVLFVGRRPQNDSLSLGEAFSSADLPSSTTKKP